MKHDQRYRKTQRVLILACSGLLWVGPVNAQDHDHSAASVPDHAGVHGDPEPQATAHAMPMPEGQAGVRDPHGYSGGYTRISGPYAVPESQQLRLADEMVFAGLWVDRFETREGSVEDFQEFAGHAWFGNSYRRFILRSELEWRDLSIAESKTELLYSRAISPFWNIQLGGRFDHGDKAHREWLAFGVSGLAPFWFEVNANAYLNPEGHAAATVEAEYDLLLSQRLILQPRIAVDFFGDSDLEAGHGKGLSKSEMGLRLRYEISRQFAPYIGYERVHRHGEAVAVFEPLGQHRETQWIAGFRFWF